MRVTRAVARRAVLVLAASLFAARGAFAETRTVRGTVTLEGAAVDRAVVKIEDPKTLAVRSYITQNDGQYHFAMLQTEVDYTIWAERRGKRSGKKILSRFNSDREPRLDLKLD